MALPRGLLECDGPNLSGNERGFRGLPGFNRVYALLYLPSRFSRLLARLSERYVGIAAETEVAALRANLGAENPRRGCRSLHDEMESRYAADVMKADLATKTPDFEVGQLANFLGH